MIFFIIIIIITISNSYC